MRILDADCAEVPEDHSLLSLMNGVARDVGVKPRSWALGAHSDMGLPNGLGRTPTINFDPGGPSQAHQPNESVPVADLVAATKMIALALGRWCA